MTQEKQELKMIKDPSQAIALYNITPEKIAIQLKEYDHLKVVPGDTKSYKQVRSAHTALVTTRTTGDKRRKKLGEDARKQVSYINEAWKMLLAPMTPYEDRFKVELKAEDDRKAAIKAEKARIEQERIDKIDEKIREFDYAVSATLNMPAENVANLCDEIVAIQITEEVYQEFTAKAKGVKLATLSALDDIYNDKVTQEKESAERKAEIAKLEKIQKENEAAQAKIDTERAQLEEGKRLEAEARDRVEFERKAKEQAEVQAKRQVEQERQKQEKEKIEAEKEAKRVEAVKPDKEKLIAFADFLIGLDTPIVKSKEASIILDELHEGIDNLQATLRQQAEAL